LGQIEERHSMRRIPLGDRDHQAQVRLDQPLRGDLTVVLHPPEELDHLRTGPRPIRPSHFLQAPVLKLPLRVELVLADQGHGVNHEAESLLVDPVRRIDGGKQLGGEPSGLHPHGQVNLLGGGKQGDSADVLQVHPNWIVGGCVVPAPRDLSAFLSLLFGLLPRDLEDLDALLAKVLLHVHEEALDLFAAELVHGKPLEKVLGGNEALLPPRRDGLQSLLEMARLVPLP
jgi:hypothetical protein